MTSLTLLELLAFFENSINFGLLANSRLAYVVSLEVLYFFDLDILLTIEDGFYLDNAVF